MKVEFRNLPPVATSQLDGWLLWVWPLRQQHSILSADWDMKPVPAG